MIHIAHQPLYLFGPERAALYAANTACGPLDVECRVKRAVRPMVGWAAALSIVAAGIAVAALVRR